MSEQMELKPCPFCGKKRHLRFEPFEGSTDTGIVVCICGASYTTIEQGADCNVRPIEDRLNKQVAELEAKLEGVLENNLKFRSVCYHLLSEGEKLQDVLVAWKALEDSEDGGAAVKAWYQKHKDVLGNEANDDNK
ncbi:MAG: hypothetical protein KBA03_03665 [Anaerolineaceae bacterium]|nr:hypothetical protein [Anaerolineaceae bacterium]